MPTAATATTRATAAITTDSVSDIRPPRRLTEKLRGRPEAPDWSRGCTLSPHTRGDTADSHGPPQRLLAVATSCLGGHPTAHVRHDQEPRCVNLLRHGVPRFLA